MSTGLRTAVATEYKLNKEETAYDDDIVDGFRLAYNSTRFRLAYNSTRWGNSK
jgi:hypothetical protein